MSEMLTPTLELLKTPAFTPGLIDSSSSYVIRCTKCGHVEKINADFWKDFIQNPYCSYCKYHSK